MDPFTLALIGSGIFGGLGALFGGKGKETTKEQPYAVPWAKDVLASWIFSPFVFNEEANTWESRGLPAYPEKLNPNLDETLLPKVWEQYGQGNPAMPWLQNSLNQGFGLNQQDQSNKDWMMQYGGPKGQATDQMWKQAQYGGQGQKGFPAMDNLMQWGVTNNNVGQYLTNLAQYGVPSEAGRMVANRAQGFPVSGATFLQAYQKPAAFQTMPWMTRRS